MKKINNYLLAIVMIFNVNATFVNPRFSFTPIVYAQEKIVPENIFDENYSDEYVAFSESSLINRFVNEIRKNFEVEGIRNNTSPYSIQSVSIKLNRPNESREFYDMEIMEISLKEDFHGEGLSLVFSPSSPRIYDDEKFYNFILKLFDHNIDIKDLPKDIFKDDTITNLPNSSVKTSSGKLGNQIFIPLQYKFDNNEVNNLIDDDASDFDLSEILEYEYEKYTQEVGLEEESVEQPTNSSSEFNPDNYEILTYEEIMRDRDGKAGTPHTFYAEVMQYTEEDNMAFALLKRNGDINQLYQAIFLILPDSRLVEGDNIDVYGMLMGLEDYETVIGGTNTTPYIIVNKVLIEGIDY